MTENKELSSFTSARVKKKGTPLYYGKSHYVVENTYRKNVSFGACHYVDENKDT